jgi:hypothetical protein
MFIKAGQYDGMSDDLFSEIVRNCQAIDKPFLKKKMTVKIVLSYTHERTLCVPSE